MALTPAADVLYRIKRGLAGYVSYLAACEMNESFSEYILYEPTLRILTARGFSVTCESPCPGTARQAKGDFKRLDFVARAQGAVFALEMKWARSKRLDVASDVNKLKAFRSATPGASGFLCVFGRRSALAELTLTPSGLREQGRAVYAEFGITKYGCRTYHVEEDS
jgi:Holliday junction resolvase